MLYARHNCTLIRLQGADPRLTLNPMTDLASLAGRLLLAMPGMPDPRFEAAVVALCIHDTEGALGIGIGDVLDKVTLFSLLDDLKIPRGVAPDCEVHHGGAAARLCAAHARLAR